MKPKRVGALIATLTIALALFPAATAQGRPEREVHVLTGVSKFTASATAKTLVRFPKPVTFFKEFKPSYTGDGRVTGFILRKLGHYEQEGYRPVMESASIGRCKESGCKSKGSDFTFIVCFCDDEKLAGTWELYVIADGAPVTVTFRSKNLGGTDHVSVREKANAQVQTLDPRVEESTGHTLMSAGDYTELDQADFGLVGLWAVGNPHAATTLGDCMYYDYSDEGDLALLPPEEIAFLPGCPTGDGYVHPIIDPNGGRGGAIFTSAGFGPTVGVGGWYQTAAVVQSYGAVAFWLDF